MIFGYRGSKERQVTPRCDRGYRVNRLYHHGPDSRLFRSTRIFASRRELHDRPTMATGQRSGGQQYLHNY